MLTGYIIVSPTTERKKRSLCGDLEAAAESTREKDLEDHEGQIRSLCAERCLTIDNRSCALDVQSAA